MHVTISCRAATIALAVLIASARGSGGQDLTLRPPIPTSPGLLHVGDLVGMPFAGSTPAIGFALGAAGAYLMQQRDTTAPPSAVGLGGFYSTNGSWFVMVAGRTWLQRDEWRATGAIAGFSLTYDFFGVGTNAGNRDQSMRLTQPGSAGLADVLYRVARDFYLGPRYRYVNLTTDVEVKLGAPIIAVVQRDREYVGSLFGGVAEYDTRNTESGPTRGTLGQASAMFARTGFGSDRSFDRFIASANVYIALPFQQVLATRVAGCGLSGDPPPWELCLYGLDSDLRGYQTGQYRDRSLLTGQVEWRVPVWGRLGAVGFFGTGEVAPSIGAMTHTNLLPSGGAGGRWLVSRTYHASVGVDYAWAKHGGAFYFRLGDAF